MSQPKILFQIPDWTSITCFLYELGSAKDEERLLTSLRTLLKESHYSIRSLLNYFSGNWKKRTPPTLLNRSFWSCQDFGKWEWVKNPQQLSGPISEILTETGRKPEDTESIDFWAYSLCQARRWTCSEDLQPVVQSILDVAFNDYFPRHGHTLIFFDRLGERPVKGSSSSGKVTYPYPLGCAEYKLFLDVDHRRIIRLKGQYLQTHDPQTGEPLPWYAHKKTSVAPPQPQDPSLWTWPDNLEVTSLQSTINQITAPKNERFCYLRIKRGEIDRKVWFDSLPHPIELGIDLFGEKHHLLLDTEKRRVHLLKGMALTMYDTETGELLSWLQ